MTNTLNRLRLHTSQHYILLLSIAISTILHILLIAKFAFNLPVLVEDRQILKAELVNLQPAKPVSAIAIAEEAVAPQAEQAEPENTPADIPPEPQSEPEPSPAVGATGEEITSPGTLSSATLNMPAPSVPDMPEDNADNELKAAVENDSDIEPERTAYTHVETEFEVRRGTDTSTAGITKITFNIDNNGSYSIYSLTQAKGLVSLFFSNLIQTSEGNVTNKGLKPNYYSYQYGNDEKKLQSAHFNWNDGVVKLHNSRGDSSVKLREGTQDFLSFMYQFMFTPPLENLQITMTNGKRLRTYTYSFEGEETITTKLGELKTVHLLKSSGDEEKTEIWLASDYQYLPVRIRKTEKDGTVIEQLATKLSTNQMN